MTKIRLAAAVSASLMLLAGCGSSGSDDTDDAGNDRSDTTASESSEQSGTDDESTPTDETDETDAAELPKGWATVEATRANIAFGAPADWSVLDEDAVDKPEFAAAIKAFAASAQLSEDDVERLLRTQVDVIVLADSSENVNVTNPPIDELPSEQEVRDQFTALSATVSEVTEIDTPVGDGLAVYYELPTPVGVKYGAGLFVEAASGVVNLTVTRNAARDAREQLDQTISTLVELD